MGLREQIAQRLARIPLPAAYSLADISVIAPIPELVQFSSLELSSLQTVPTLIAPAAVDIPAWLKPPATIAVLGKIEDALAKAELASPRIETLLFQPLSKPRLAGKAYRDETDTIQHTLPGLATPRREFDLEERCIHGLLKAFCTVCRPEAQRPRQPKLQIVDVFEQLRYILQPPILERLGQPDVFPEGRKPYPFQIAGIKWLLDHSQALLADEMGLGKTIQAIVAMRVLFRRGELQRALVICPVSVAETWRRELRAWAPELVPMRIKGPGEVRAEQWRAPAEVYIVSFETLAHDTNLPQSQAYDLCIVDEAQRIKNPGADRSKAVKWIQAKYRWALTGTPLENKLEDTVSIFGFVAPALFNGDYAYYPSLLRPTIAPYTLRRTAEEVGLDLPPLEHQEHWLELTEAQRAAYDSEERSGVSELRDLGKAATRVHIFSLISKLKQICNYEDKSKESCKLEFLIDEMEKLLDNREKALVFSQYPNVTLRKIKPYLERFKPQLFEGSLDEQERTRVVDEFQQRDVSWVLLMGVGSGGTGITLTRANHVFHFDHWWNPAVVDQATARIYRIGQQRPVFVHSLYTKDTIEERIAEILDRKRELFRDVFGELEDKEATKRLSDEDLFGLFGLQVPGKRQDSPLSSVSPIEFERRIQRLFTALGYKVSVTKQTHDGGIDLEGVGLGLGQGRVAVQCKRYTGTVSVGEVREFWGVIADSDVTQGFFVTTGQFSDDARKFASGKRLRLIDGAELDMLLSQSNVK